MKQSWVNALKQNLNDNDKVYELHFNDKDVIKFFETKLPNGLISKIPRDRYSLATGAVPVLQNDSKKACYNNLFAL